MKDIHVRIQSQKEAINTLQSVEEIELPDCSRIQKMGKLLTYLQEKRDSITSLKELIQKLEPVLDSDEVYEVDELKELVSQVKIFKSLRDKYQGALDSIDSLQTELEDCQKELSEVDESLTDFEVCPLCGEVNENHHHSS
jgi:DNA repair ATPase RecN